MSDDDINKPEKRRGIFSKLKGALSRKKHLDQTSAEIIESLEKTNSEISSNKREMLFNVASFDRLNVGDVMIPRADIVAVEIDTPLGELAQLFIEHQHSRMPIYRESLDNPLGFVHVKDVMALLAPNADGVIEAKLDELPLGKIKRDLVYVPLSMRLPSLLIQMRTLRCHIALVVDEYGGTDGLVTIEDLVEEIIGDIDDEYDNDDEPIIFERQANVWEADAKITFEEFLDATGIDCSIESEDEIDTLGGVAFSLVGRVPPRGEIISHPNGIELEILEADPRRIKKILIRKTIAPNINAIKS